MDKYSFGKCSVGSQYKALKIEVCVDCKEPDMPEFLKDLFKQEK